MEINRLHKKDGISIATMNFSDPQSGKGQCDRRAAHFKGHFRRIVNGGKNITNADEIVQSFENIPDSIAFLCELSDNIPKPTLEVENISILNNFVFNGQKLTCWRQHKVGKGRVETVKVNLYKGCVRSIVCTQKVTGQHQGYLEPPTKRIRAEKVPVQDDEDNEDESLLYACSENCTKVFIKYGNLKRHIDAAIHTPPRIDTSLADRSKKLFKAISEKSTPGHIHTRNIASTSTDTSGRLPEFSSGYGLKCRKPPKRFSEKQKKFLDDIFNRGVSSKIKCTPSDAAKKMREAIDLNGQKMFKIEDCLKDSQIKSYFGRKAKKEQYKVTDDGILDTIDEEINLSDLVTKVRLQIPE